MLLIAVMLSLIIFVTGGILYFCDLLPETLNVKIEKIAMRLDDSLSSILAKAEKETRLTELGRKLQGWERKLFPGKNRNDPYNDLYNDLSDALTRLDKVLR